MCSQYSKHKQNKAKKNDLKKPRPIKINLRSRFDRDSVLMQAKNSKTHRALMYVKQVVRL